MVYFTDFFKIEEEILDTYGAFNISLINDLPLFIDPFLLFGSKKKEYNKLHKDILVYLTFLKSKSQNGHATKEEIESWYTFSEIKQNWLGFSISGNDGLGLGPVFGNAMSANMHLVFDDLNKETITSSSHIEKVGLFQLGIGKDNISDFTCNLIKYYLLKYTENFAKKYLNDSQVEEINVGKVYFDYNLEKWMPKNFILPYYNNDYVILTPKDLLTKDENWINSNDLRGDFHKICSSISNTQLRGEINRYFRSKLPAPVFIGKGPKKKLKKPTRKQTSKAINETIQHFPKILNYYIKLKEENKVGAKNISQEMVNEIETLFKGNVSFLIDLIEQTKFYDCKPTNSFKEAFKRVEFLKDVIENKDGYRAFYDNKGFPIKKEADLQIMYRLTWFNSSFDVNREVNNGRGPVDVIISKGSKDKSLVEFKLASNSKLKMNLENQVGVYEKASDTEQSIKVILYFDQSELLKIIEIIKDLKLENEKSIVLIDASKNKPSASNVK